jgi:hypothetical protein
MLRPALWAIGAVAISASGARAQAIPGVNPHTSVTTRITAAVRPILTLANVELAGVERAAAQSMVSSRAVIRANVPYRLAVRAAATLDSERERVIVRDVTGAWVPLSNDQPVVVAEAAAGVNIHEVACRVLSAVDGAQSAADPGACSHTFELGRRNGGTVLAAVAVLPVAVGEVAASSTDRRRE